MDFAPVPLARLDAKTMQDLPYEATDTDDENLDPSFDLDTIVQNWILNTRSNYSVGSGLHNYAGTTGLH